MNNIKWYFNWYKFKYFYISKKKLFSLDKTKIKIFYFDQFKKCININIKLGIKNKVLEQIIDNDLNKLKELNQFELIKINKNEFIEWFDNNKKNDDIYVFVNDKQNISYFYKYIRFNGYKSYIFKLKNSQ